MYRKLEHPRAPEEGGRNEKRKIEITQGGKISENKDTRNDNNQRNMTGKKTKE